MFKHIVTQISGRLMALFTQALALLKELLLRLVSYLLASCILVFLSVANLYNLVVRLVLKCKALLAKIITAVLSIKQGPIAALMKQWGRGLQRLITALQIHRVAPTAPKQKKGKPVGVTKSARSHLSANKTAQTPTAPKLTQAGLKSQGHAKTRRQRAKQPLKAKA